MTFAALTPETVTEAFAAVVRFQRRHRVPPTMRDLQSALRLSSTSMVTRRRDLMAEAGMIAEATPGDSRSLIVAERFACPACGGSGIAAEVEA